MSFLDIARSRSSAREFDPLPVSEADRERILEAGALAPSSRNIRPVRLIRVDSVDDIRRLSGCKDSGTRALETATFAVVVAADAGMSDVWIEDASIAAIMMQLEAEELGAGSCWIQIRNRTRGEKQAGAIVRDTVRGCEGLEILAIVAFGKRARLHLSYSECSAPIWSMHLPTTMSTSSSTVEGRG